jgi:hypothetical protein
MGESVRIMVRDPETDEKFETELDLEKIILLNVEKKLPKIKLNDDIAIQFQYPSFSDFSKITFKTKNAPNTEESLDMMMQIAALYVQKLYTKEKTIDCSEIPTEEIIEFINNLPKKEFDNFCSFFKTMPSLNYTSEFKNPITGKTFPVEVNDFNNFFTL